MIPRAALVLLVLIIAGLPGPVRAAQQDTEEAEEAEAATLEISRLEISGRIDELYGHLHPAAQRLMPREVFLGWYEAEFTPRGPSLLTVRSVTFEAWTWPLTGAHYPDTAAVAFSQPFADGTVEEGVVHLIEREGRWLWLPSIDRVWLHAQIERFTVQPTSTTGMAQTGRGAGADSDDDRECQETAQYWATDLRMGTNAIAVLSGCRQDRSGRWFLPTGPADPRLPEPILTPEEERQTAALRAQIEAQLSLSDFAATLPSWMPEQLDRLMGQPPFVKRPVTGWRDPSVMVGNLPSQYAPFLDAFLQDPNRLALRNYARWWFDRRAAAAPLAACDNLNPIACQAVQTQLGIGARPWPWDLTDPFTLVEYLDWALANGLVSVSATTVPTPIPTSTPTTPSTAACPGLGVWLGETAQRYRSAVAAIEAVGLYPFPDPEAVAQFGRNAADLERLITEQEASDAPAAGLALNAVLIRALETYQDSFAVLTEAYRSGDQAMAGEGWALRQEAQDYWGEAGRLLHDLEAECGAGEPTAASSASVPTTSQTTGIAGATYTSPQFGYVVTWQSPWDPTMATSDPEAGDYLRLGTGDVAMEYHAFSTDQPVEQALEAFVAERARAHPGATPHYQAPGGGLNSDSPALWSFDYTRADGVVMGETTIAFSVGSDGTVLMRTVTRPEDDASPRALFYAVALVLDPLEATAAAQ